MLPNRNPRKQVENSLHRARGCRKLYRVLDPSHTRSLLLKPQQMLPNRYAKKQLETACMCSTDITLGVQLCSMHLKDRCFKGGPPALMLSSKEGEVALPYTLQSYGTGGFRLRAANTGAFT